MNNMVILRLSIFSLFANLLFSNLTYASVKLESNVVVLNEFSGATFTVSNLGDSPVLMKASIEDEQVDDFQVLISPSATILYPKQSTQFRFFLDGSDKKLSTQKYKRVKFVSVPQVRESEIQVTLATAQVLPLIINPKDLEIKNSTYDGMASIYDNGKLYIYNNSKYVVRLKKEVYIGSKKATLDKHYIEPLQKVLVPNVAYNNEEHIKITPVSLYGFSEGEKLIKIISEK